MIRLLQRLRAWLAREPARPLYLVLLLYLALLLPTLLRQGISWDEQADLDIALSFVNQPGGWLVGSELDASQTRLPMFAVAMVFRALGRDDLLIARLVSVLVGLVTLLGVYVFCRRRLSHRTGIVATLILATSPFFLSFARVAFTETDVYVAAALAWLLVAMDWARERVVVGRVAVVGALLGLAISAKFTAVALLPAVWIALLMRPRQAGARADDPGQPARGITGVTLLSAVFVVVAWQFVHAGYPSHSWYQLLSGFWLLATGWLLVMGWTVSQWRKTSSPVLLVLFATAVAGMTFLLLPPVHLTNSLILDTLFDRAGNEAGVNLAFAREALSLHFFSILFKSGPLPGAWLLTAGVAALWQWRRPEFQFPLLVCIFYGGSLLLISGVQTFYTIPLLPVLAIFAADLFLRLLARARTTALALAAAAVLLWSVDIALCYPDYNLNGYQWVGARMLGGRASIGYRSVVQTPSDGVEQAIRWLNANARPGETVASYAREWYIIERTAPAPHYQLHHMIRNSDIPEPDYVVFQPWTLLVHRWTVNHPVTPYPDPGWLQTNYTRAFTVRRAFDIEMAAVWKRARP